MQLWSVLKVAPMGDGKDTKSREGSTMPNAASSWKELELVASHICLLLVARGKCKVGTKAPG